MNLQNDRDAGPAGPVLPFSVSLAWFILAGSAVGYCLGFIHGESFGRLRVRRALAYARTVRVLILPGGRWPT